MISTAIPPNWKEVVQRAGTGKDPFRYLLRTVDELAYPKVPDSLFGILIGFAAVYFAVIVICFCLLIIPVTRGQDARKRHFWLYKKHHLPSSNTPYYIYNSGLFARRIYMYVWLPGYYGFHVTAFSSLYTSFLNVLFFTIPVLVTIQTAVWALLLFISTKNQNQAYLEFASAALAGSKNWTTSVGVETSASTLVLSRLTAYLHTCDKFVVIARWAAVCWSLIGLVLAGFYAFAAAVLIKLLKHCMNVAGGTVSHFTRTWEYHVETPGALDMSFDSIKLKAQPAIKRLNDEYVYLVGHCSVMTVCLLSDGIVGIVIAIKTERTVTDPKWRIVGNWITLVGSCFISVAMLIQSWRMLSERDTTQSSSTSMEKCGYEEEVTPARFIVETDDDFFSEELHQIQKISGFVEDSDVSSKNTIIPSELSLHIETEKGPK
ncbi:uncharacterized protein MELLADRAFT_93641 [Melampsora larici-populina 98AG31]|uniref:Uncharacterized protein n=1 Tax=Melampsora larici-populina (strain 98AG31 / pathotype 3-4-7) TaxID=747676 RepID=F4R9Y1_MELLP|nr:uncharacterized protein MELLADRAFT_93641 [Melampsora larici-populina 98AG31]EGG10611.1 hypothetical protein MELLADRAFT_93641 [Melampsora larici-populina 98AG31]